MIYIIIKNALVIVYYIHQFILERNLKFGYLKK